MVTNDRLMINPDSSCDSCVDIARNVIREKFEFERTDLVGVSLDYYFENSFAATRSVPAALQQRDGETGGENAEVESRKYADRITGWNVWEWNGRRRDGESLALLIWPIYRCHKLLARTDIVLTFSQSLMYVIKIFVMILSKINVSMRLFTRIFQNE